MSFSRANVLGWALYEVLTSAQMNALDIDHANAIDGAAGGTYNPTNPVIFGADKLRAQPGAGDLIFQEPYVEHASYSSGRTYPVTNAPYLDHFVYGSRYIYQDDVTSASSAELPFVCLPHVGTLTELNVIVTGAGGHGALPATIPNVSLYRDVGAAVGVLVATANDPSPAVGAYESAHLITLTGFSESVSPNNLYRLIILGEAGANAVVGLQVHSFNTVMTVTRNYP